jgi:hypothetical protein
VPKLRGIEKNYILSASVDFVAKRLVSEFSKVMVLMSTREQENQCRPPLKSVFPVPH